MTTTPTDKQTRLIETATKLAHQRGFNQTTLADIARESGVPLGNVYYYFKTKEALGEAVIDKLACTLQVLRTKWDASPDPKLRLEAFIQMSIDNRDLLARSGCPVGTLCTELHKEASPLALEATKLFAELLEWLEAQFRLIGKKGESRDLAVHLLSALEGASLLANTFHTADYVVREANRLKEWVRALPVGARRGKGRSR
jgi:TetR/AcrR family transcriptional regulator, transcriptional repressor for nem operon